MQEGKVSEEKDFWYCCWSIVDNGSDWVRKWVMELCARYGTPKYRLRNLVKTELAASMTPSDALPSHKLSP